MQNHRPALFPILLTAFLLCACNSGTAPVSSIQWRVPNVGSYWIIRFTDTSKVEVDTFHVVWRGTRDGMPNVIKIAEKYAYLSYLPAGDLLYGAIDWGDSVKSWQRYPMSGSSPRIDTITYIQSYGAKSLVINTNVYQGQAVRSFVIGTKSAIKNSVTERNIAFDSTNKIISDDTTGPGFVWWIPEIGWYGLVAASDSGPIGAEVLDYKIQ